MAANDVELCNLALGHISGAAILSLTEGSNEAIECSRFYRSTLRSVLRRKDWNFASVFKELTELDDVPDAAKGGWTHVYSYPSDCVSMREILNNNQVAAGGPFGYNNAAGSAYGPPNTGPPSGYYGGDRSFTLGNRQGFGSDEGPTVLYRIAVDAVTNTKRIYTDVPNAIGRYTRFIELTTLFDPEFDNMFAWLLASYLAMPIARNTDLARHCFQMYNGMMGITSEENDNEAPGTLKNPPGSYILGRDGY
jgi:hypothetical protein